MLPGFGYLMRDRSGRGSAYYRVVCRDNADSTDTGARWYDPLEPGTARERQLKRFSSGSVDSGEQYVYASFAEALRVAENWSVASRAKTGRSFWVIRVAPIAQPLVASVTGASTRMRVSGSRWVGTERRV